MVFSSHLFIFYFLPFVLLLNYALPFRFLSLMLVCVSYCFYGWMNPKWILLMFTSSFIDYFCGLALVKFSGLPADGRELPLLPRDQPQVRPKRLPYCLDDPEPEHSWLLRFLTRYRNLNAVLERYRVGSVQHPVTARRSADRDILLHFQSMSGAIDASRRSASATQPDRFRVLRRCVSAPAGRAQHSLLEHCRPVPRQKLDLYQVRPRRRVLLHRTQQEDHSGEFDGSCRRYSLFGHKPPRIRGLVWRHRLCISNLF